MGVTDAGQYEWQPTSAAQVSVEFLSEADDLLTRYLFDWILFDEPVVGGRNTAKMNLNGAEGVPRAARRTDQDLQHCRQVVQDLRKGECTVQCGIDRLAKVNAFEDFAERWEDGDMLFLHHLKRYAHALSPNSGVAFHETNRYSKPNKSANSRQTPSPTPEPNSVSFGSRPSRTSLGSLGSPAGIEVAVFATRKFKKGEEINLCRGGVADLTEEEDDLLRQGGQKADFSVLYSSRKKSFGLLLGPARFVNHDCRNNVEFVFGQQDMRFRAIEDIQPNEEIFTHYGIHYFEQNNAGCLCATCEQLQRGGFTPKLKAEPTPFKRETTPTRKSTRNPADAAPGTGHELIAQRSIKTGTSRSRSPSSDSESSTSSQPERRRNERRAAATPDKFRTRPRLVQPKLPPPPLYAPDYEYDAKKKTIKYTGPTSVAQGKVRGSATPSPLPPQPPTRKRAREESPADALKRKRLSVVTVTQTTTKVEKRTRTVESSTSSSRATKPLNPPKQPQTTSPSRSLFVPPAKFAAKADAKVTLQETTAIECITLDDTTDGSTDEDQIALMLVRSRSSSSGRKGQGFRSGSDSKPGENESSRPGWPPTPRSPSPRAAGKMRGRPVGRGGGGGPTDDGSPTPGQANGAAGGEGGAGSSGEASATPAGRPTSLGVGSGWSGGIGGGNGGDGGDDGQDRKPFKSHVASPVDVDVELEATERIELEDNVPAAGAPLTEVAHASGRDTGLLTPALSTSGRDETDQEAARLLLAMGALFGSCSASSSASSAKTTLPASSSTTSLDDSFSTKSQLSAKAKGKRRATDGPATLGTVKAEEARANRRRSHLDEPSSGRSSLSPAGSARSGTDKRRVSQLGSRSASGSRSPRPTPPPPVEGARGTRASAPIKGGVHDLLSTPEVASVSGTFDPRSGKYLSARRSASVGSGLARDSSVEASPEVVRAISDDHLNGANKPQVSKAVTTKLKNRPSGGAISSSPGAVTSAPTRAPLISTKSAPAATPARPSGRSTRSSFPLDSTALDQLLHAPGAVGGSGYDVITGKYLPLRQRPGAAGSPTAESSATTSSEAAAAYQPIIYAANGSVVHPAAASPELAAAASAAILSASTRSTRRSRPIDIPLQALMRDPAVASVAGAWDDVQQKYVMPRRTARRGSSGVVAAASPVAVEVAEEA